MAKKYNEIEAKNNMNITKEEDITVTTEKKELKQVVSVQPKKVKKGLIGRLVSGVLGPEGAAGIGEYVNEEIVKPAIKNIIVDAVTSGINMIMYGERGGRPGGGYGSGYRSYGTRPGGGYSSRPTNYTSRYTSQQPEPVDRRANVRGSRYVVEEYVIEDRYDAASVLTTLTEHADMYDNVSVADYYDLIGVPSQYTDNQYGWTIDSISRATIIPVRGGYIIKLPPVEVIQ